MKESFVGKTLRDEKDEEYIVLTELTYQNIPCVYAMKVLENEKEGDKLFFQLTGDEDVKLVSIKSKKMLLALSETLLKGGNLDDKPRKIKEEESIADYLAYLDDFYRSKVVTIM
ncbi:MAG: hypothetical protein E7164_03500 [Firmicutes bacterium]|nr:hypothetical protein [Bacillota bacterium]